MARKLRIVAAIIVVGVVVAMTLYMPKSSNNEVGEEVVSSLPYSPCSADIRTDSITEFIVELGQVPYSALATETIRVRNTTDKPLSLVEYRATCRCTWIELPLQPIAPDAWGEAEIFFDSRGEFGDVGNFIDISTSDERCRIGVWISAEVTN